MDYHNSAINTTNTRPRLRGLNSDDDSVKNIEWNKKLEQARGTLLRDIVWVREKRIILSKQEKFIQETTLRGFYKSDEREKNLLIRKIVLP